MAQAVAKLRGHLVWRWHPLAVALFVLLVDFGALFMIRAYEHGSFYMPWGNKTFLLGDSIFLPLYAGFASVVVHRTPAAHGGWYGSRVWHISVAVVGVFLALMMDLMATTEGHTSMFVEFRLSKAYHTVVFALLLYLLVSVLPVTIRGRRATWATTLALTALALYLAIAFIEIQPMASASAHAAAYGLTGIPV
jgi:hypothetical protein